MKKRYEIISQLYDNMDDATRALAEQNRFSYILGKAIQYLTVGPVIYRKNDFFNQPLSSINEEELAFIKNGCQQLLQGKGFTIDNPFTGLEVGGFYRLFDLFHFEFHSRITHRTMRNKMNVFIDEMKMQHIIDQSVVVYFNLIEY